MSVDFLSPAPHIGVIRVNRPHVRNALDWNAMESFAHHIENAYQQNLRALIVTGADNTFIAGGDLTVLHHARSLADGERLSRIMTNALNRLESLPFPVIAAMNGATRGGGAEIALACDMRVMAEDATFGLVQINLGLIPGWGGAHRLLRLIGYSRSLELLTSGRILSAEEMHSLGLVNTIAPPSSAYEVALKLAHQITAKSPAAIKSLKAILTAGTMCSYTMAARLEQDTFPTLWASEEHHKAVEHYVRRKK